MEVMAEQLRSVIVRFKKKDNRAETKKDKTEILMNVVQRPLTFVNSAMLVPGAAAMPRSTVACEVAYDVNEYHMPLIAVHVTDDQYAALKQNPNVEDIEDDGKVYALGAYDTRALFFEDQPVVQAETVPTGISQIKAPDAWDCTRGKGVKVAVLDTGIDFNHPDLAANYKSGISFVPTETSPMDNNRHGTHCAGTIAAAINGVGVVGVAPAASLYAVKVLAANGSGNWSWLIVGLDWCVKNGIHIASMSLGAASAPSAVKDMCDLAFAKGVLLVAAAGNTGGPVGAPAQYQSVIAVSAIDSANTIAPFSCRGPEVELCAPGVDVLSTVPGGAYSRLSGTSMACPHVSGAAALAWATHRYPPTGLAQNVVIRRLLAMTADNLGVPGRDDLFGFGRVDAELAAFEFTVPPAMPGLP
jgi:subtilisin